MGGAIGLTAAGVDLLGIKALVARYTDMTEFFVLTENIITQGIFPFTAGGFIYIALASILPDLLAGRGNEDGKLTGKKNAPPSVVGRIFQGLVETAGIVAGVGLMAFIATKE